MGLCLRSSRCAQRQISDIPQHHYRQGRGATRCLFRCVLDRPSDVLGMDSSQAGLPIYLHDWSLYLWGRRSYVLALLSPASAAASSSSDPVCPPSRHLQTASLQHADRRDCLNFVLSYRSPSRPSAPSWPPFWPPACFSNRRILTT